MCGDGGGLALVPTTSALLKLRIAGEEDATQKPMLSGGGCSPVYNEHSFLDQKSRI